jgi:hypothetical protein
MKKLARIVSGILVGAAMLGAGGLAAPAQASTGGGGFCDETPNYVCCCSTNSDGSINDCACMPKGGVAPT